MLALLAYPGIYIGGYLAVPGLIAEFLVRERAEKLRNLLTVMGCSFRAYWLGTHRHTLIRTHTHTRTLIRSRTHSDELERSPLSCNN